MAALVQSYPQQSGSVTMLQTRPTSASGILPHPQSQSSQQYSHGGSHQRNSFHGLPGGVGGGYRGNTGPVQPYAFTSTPSLNPSVQWQQFGTYRTSSSPAVPTIQAFEQNHNFGRGRYPTSTSMTNLPVTASYGISTSGSRDDSSLPATNRRVAPAPRPQSAYMAGSHSHGPFPQGPAPKVSPERYRRPPPRTSDSSGSVQQPQGQLSAAPSGSGMGAVGHIYNSRGAPEYKGNTMRTQGPTAPRPHSFYATMPGSAADDIQLYRHPDVEAKRFRRRSMPALDHADFSNPLTPHEFQRPDESSRRPEQLAAQRSPDKEENSAKPGVSNTAVEKTTHSRNESSESTVSSRSSNSRPSSSANRNTNAFAPTGNPALISTVPDQTSSNQDYPRLVNIPPRSSSSDAATKVVNPSPLSKPVTMDSAADSVAIGAAAENSADATLAGPNSAQAAKSVSPAVKQLSALSEKGGRLRSKTSRLRRAFSFGSAAEFRKAGVGEADNTGGSHPGASTRLHKDPTPDELYDAEQARIAQKQEEGGIGNNIYSGGKIFHGSTDNISISSTASSASIMIRKMGRGMKKGTRSLVGLFRPKSVVGAPAADATIPEVSQAAVSMITVEAEREKVNVNPDPHSQHGGGTGFPRLERNSIDAAKAPSLISERAPGSSGTDTSAPRKTIVGSETERAEILAAVRKGILKNTSGSSSPSVRPADARGPAFDLPNVPPITDSPSSSAPSTPNDEAQGHKRTGSVSIGNEDYFVTALRLRQDTKSAPGTPQSTIKRNATFSPRIVFYDTWPSQEYDRRGEIATCNRLTPMLAQQIKEELNSFKMEMEVHENSKIYTHFF